MLFTAVLVTAVFLCKRKWSKKSGEDEMPSGLQVFNESGDVVIDLTTRMTVVQGTASFHMPDDNTRTYTLNNAFSGNGTPFFFPVNLGDVVNNYYQGDIDTVFMPFDMSIARVGTSLVMTITHKSNFIVSNINKTMIIIYGEY